MRNFFIIGRDSHQCLSYTARTANTPEAAMEWFLNVHRDIKPLEILEYTKRFNVSLTSAFVLDPKK